MRSFLLGVLVALVAAVGGAGYYVLSGRAPVAVADPAFPFEKNLAEAALDAHIEHQPAREPPFGADDATLAAGARVYRTHCAGCHNLPGQPQTTIGPNLYPPAPELFKGQGVTDDPVFESYWKVANGIRLTGMPAFKTRLTEAELWQVSQLVARANQLPDSARKLLAPAGPSGAPVQEAGQTPAAK
jgi:thiosulfate dehydrogenase